MNLYQLVLAKASPRLVRAAVAAIAVATAMGALSVLVLVGALAGQEQQQQSSSGCSQPGDGDVVQAANLTDGHAPSLSSYDPEQLKDASAIISVGKRVGVPAYGWVVAVAAAMQESGLHNLHYGDRDSEGLFQQRPSAGWGTLAQITNPVDAALAFFGKAPYTHNTGLLQVPGWQQMPVTVAAQAVQHSGFPSAYAQHAAAAAALVHALAPSVSPASLQYTPTSAGCTAGQAGLNTSVVMPLPQGSYTDENNYGQTSARWASFHTGDDLSAPCGTPVSAATSGRIIVKRGPGWSWAGRWLVQVQTGPGQLTTWYGHMQQLDVRNGQQVRAGQRIGEVGDLGNATGCHLHFEVHPHGGGYMQDQVDPHPWLLRNVGQTLHGAVPLQTGAGGRPLSVSAPHGIPARGPGVRFVEANLKISEPSARFRADLRKVVSTAPDFVSLNEVNSRTDGQITPPGYAMYRASSQSGPRSQARETAVLWRSDRWTPIAAGTVELTRPVKGHPPPLGFKAKTDWRYATYVTLSATDGSGTVSVISTHAMVNPRFDPSPLDPRKRMDKRGFVRLAGLSQRLEAAGPVLAAGDLNAQYPRGVLGAGPEWWGPKLPMDRVGMESTFQALGAPPQGWATDDHGGTIDWMFASSATLRALDQATFPLNSDHRAVLGDFAMSGQ